MLSGPSQLNSGFSLDLPEQVYLRKSGFRAEECLVHWTTFFKSRNIDWMTFEFRGEARKFEESLRGISDGSFSSALWFLLWRGVFGIDLSDFLWMLTGLRRYLCLNRTILSTPFPLSCFWSVGCPPPISAPSPDQPDETTSPSVFLRRPLPLGFGLTQSGVVREFINKISRRSGRRMNV